MYSCMRSDDNLPVHAHCTHRIDVPDLHACTRRRSQQPAHTHSRIHGARVIQPASGAARISPDRHQLSCGGVF